MTDPNARRGEYPVPGDARVTHCACGAQIVWAKTRAQANIPLSMATVRLGADGRQYALNHFSDCPKSAQYRKPRAPGSSAPASNPGAKPPTGTPVDLRDLPDYLARNRLVVIGSTVSDDGNGKLIIVLQTRRA